MSTHKLVAIVDDDSSALAALLSLVNAFGYRTIGFADPLDFLASTTPSEAACLIADVRLPGISGIMLHQRLLRDGICLPTILVTAYPDDVTGAWAMKAGVRAYLAKPVEPECLLAYLIAATA